MHSMQYGQNLALWKWKLQLGIGLISAEFIRVGGETVRSEIHKLIPSVSNDELSHQWKESIVPIYRKGDKTDYSNYRGIYFLLTA
jgi:hypothetical protein